MRFKFKAVKPTGEHYEDVIEAPDKPSLQRLLRDKGDTVVSVSEEISISGSGSFLVSLKKSLSFFSRVSVNDKILFSRNLGSMLEAGLPMTRSLSVLERQARNQKMKTILGKIQERVTGGETLSQSMSAFPDIFPTLLISMVKAGEESGSIAGSLKSAAEQMEKTHLLFKRLRGAMIYPAIVITVMAIIAVTLLVFLVPTLTQTFEDLELTLPLSTRIIIAMSSFLKDNTLIALFSVFSVIVLLYLALRTKRGKHLLDFTLLRTPLISTLVKESNSARTARTLSSLLSAGVDFLVAIQITKEVVQNGFYKKILEEAEESVRKGSTISSIFLSPRAQTLYPPFVGEMAGIGEETGKLSGMLSNVASFYEEEVSQKTKNFSTIVEPFLMICIGLFVGIFAVSMLGPIYSLVNAL